MIVLDRNHLGLVDVEVERNAWGRQVASFEADLDVAGETSRCAASSSALRWIEEAAPTSRCSPSTTAIRCSRAQGRILVAAFHPELTDDTRVHERFLDLVEEEAHVRA